MLVSASGAASPGVEQQPTPNKVTERTDDADRTDDDRRDTRVP